MGRQGCFVHCTCVLTNQMSTHIRFFQDIGNNYSIRLQMYSAAICAGTCVTFGAPIGAVLFAMELTSTYYMVGTILKCMICSLSAIIGYHIFHGFSFSPVKPPKHTQFEDIGLSYEMIFIIILGYLCSQIAVMFNNILSKIIFLRVKLKNPFICNRWKWCMTCILFISIIGFPVKVMHFREKIIGN